MGRDFKPHPTDGALKRVSALPFRVIKDGKVLSGATTLKEAQRMAKVMGGLVESNPLEKKTK